MMSHARVPTAGPPMRRGFVREGGNKRTEYFHGKRSRANEKVEKKKKKQKKNNDEAGEVKREKKHKQKLKRRC